MYGEIPGHGGAREGAGRPPKVPDDEAAAAAGVRDSYNFWKAKGEEFKARQAELDYLEASGQYLPRAAVQQAAATAVNVFVQHVRSIGGNLERTHGLTPEVAAAIDVALDEAMSKLSDDLKELAGFGAPAA